MRRVAISIVVIAVGMTGGFILGAYHPDADPGFQHTTTSTTRCVEDDPCWDCHTMGNLICGRP